MNLKSSKYELLGKIVWLWGISKLHKTWPLEVGINYIIPAIENNQYILLEDNDGNVRGYISWAFLGKNEEKKYILDPSSLQLEDWNSGERLWFIDIIAPFSMRDVLTLRRKMSDIHGDSYFARSIRINTKTKKARVVEYTAGTTDKDKTKELKEYFFNEIKEVFHK